MAKKKKSPKKPSKLYNMYKKEGDSLNREGSFCPKCGKGVFLANHSNRKTCGKCGYTEFKKQ